MRSILLGVVATLALVPTVARAEWLQASSDHFVIYADGSERNLIHFANRLEQYHAALALVTGYTAPAPSPSNRVTVYVVSNEGAVRKLHGSGSQNVSGFYLPRASGSLAIVPWRADGFGDRDGALTVLLHEYAHHFMMSGSPMAMPRWYSEGAAEFFASTSFEADGDVMLGRPATHRGAELFMATDVIAADLLDPTEYDKRKKRSFDAFYGKSWLLYHYLTYSEARRGQIGQYMKLLAKGESQREAALAAFGDFGVLERELDVYLRQRRMSAMVLPAGRLKTNPVSIRRLRPGEAAIVPVRMRSKLGVDDETAGTVLAEARSVAAAHPGDAAVLSALAEAEYDAGNAQAAVEAADKALAIDPGEVDAYVQKGYALFRLAEGETDSAAAYRRALAPFIALNKRENDHALPLLYFYRAQTAQGKAPTELAIDGLMRASELAPFDLGLRTNLATALLAKGRKDEARVVLAPVAYNPHGGKLSSGARKILDKIAKEPDWNGRNAAVILSGGEEDKGGEDDAVGGDDAGAA